jgi:hypothetical protein
MPSMGPRYGGSTVGSGGGSTSGTPFISSTDNYDPQLAAQNASNASQMEQQRLASETQRYGYDTQASTSRYGADSQLAGTGMQTDTQRYIADQNNALGQQQLGQEGDQFNRVYGSLSSAFANPSNFGGSAATPQPGITTGGIWNPQQVQQQVNQSTAQQIQGAQTQQRTQAQQMAGQGFGSRSPALAQMQNNAMSQAMANAASNAGNIQYQAAEGNAKQNLGAESQAQAGWYQQQQQDIARRSLDQQYQSSLAAAMAGLV